MVYSSEKVKNEGGRVKGELTAKAGKRNEQII